MKLLEVMNLIDEKKLKSLGQFLKIDKVNTKITGSFILKSLVRNILFGRKISLRSIELDCNKNKVISKLLKFRSELKRRIDHSSVGKRLRTINYTYFKEIYKDVVQKYNRIFRGKRVKKFHIFDSTIIALSEKLLKNGICASGNSPNRHIKFTFGLKNSIPNSIRLCESQSEVNENVALIQAISEAKIEKEDIVLFDRGISKSETFKKLDQEDKKFITRIKENRRTLVVRKNEIETDESSDLSIISDEVVNLYAKGGKIINCDLRLIKAKTNDGKEINFLTNIDYLSAHDIAESYKKRWAIEVFFRFIKQNLQLKHFISYNKNGMMVYIYCILISAILFTIYKLLNGLSGFKLAISEFIIELEKAVIKDIVLFCGGDPNLVDLKL